MGNKLIIYCISTTFINLYYFCIMKKINLKEISEILSEKELKNVMGGSGCKGATCFQCAGFSGIYRGVLPVTV